MSEPVTRRNWLARILGGSIAATVAVIFYPVGRFLWPKAATNSGALEVKSPYKMDELVKASKEGRALPPFDFGGTPCLVFLVDGEPRAMSAVCTHLQCTVEFRAANQDLFCNCHNGVYDLNGRNVAGPPPRPLEVYRAAKGEGNPGQEDIVVSRKS
jgi:cytochrome b6-f complex iron-sulfur subunit